MFSVAVAASITASYYIVPPGVSIYQRSFHPYWAFWSLNRKYLLLPRFRLNKYINKWIKKIRHIKVQQQRKYSRASPQRTLDVSRHRRDKMRGWSCTQFPDEGSIDPQLPWYIPFKRASTSSQQQLAWETGCLCADRCFFCACFWTKWHYFSNINAYISIYISNVWREWDTSRSETRWPRRQTLGPEHNPLPAPKG